MSDADDEVMLDELDTDSLVNNVDTAVKACCTRECLQKDIVREQSQFRLFEAAGLSRLVPLC